MAKRTHNGNDNHQKAITKVSGPPTVLAETENIQRSPFVPPEVEPRESATIVAHADLLKQYVPAGITGYLPFLKALPIYIDDITQQFGIEVYERMDADPVVQSSGAVVPLAALANGWEITPSLDKEETDYDLSVKMADFVRDNLENLTTPYTTVLREQMNARKFGASVAEKAYGLDDYDGKYRGISSAPLLLRLNNLRDVPLRNAVMVVDSYNQLVGVMTQRFPGQIFPAGSFIPIDLALIKNLRAAQGDNTVDYAINARGEFDVSKRIPGFLPTDKLSIATHDMRYNDPRGHSVYRPAYQPWWLKQQTIAELLAFIAKFASPSIIATTAQNAQPQNILNADGTIKLDGAGNPVTLTPEQALGTAIEGLQNGSGLVMPFGATADVVQASGAGEVFWRTLTYCDKQISQAITGQSLATQEAEHQSKSAGEVHKDVLGLSILYCKQWIAEQQRREVYYPLLRLNFDLEGKKIRRYVPKLTLGMGDGFPLSPDDVAKLVPYLTSPARDPRIDRLLGIPVQETITVNGVKMTSREKMQRDDQAAQQQQAQQQVAANQGGQELAQ